MTEQFQFMVSVRLMTYNHELFIKQAMDGIMMQQVNFPFEVVVGDDFSNDRTLEIIKCFSCTDNISIKILTRNKGDEYSERRKSLGRLYNFSNILENCTGKYIALLDGDDFWVDPLKLQKQVDFLENNIDYSLCAHNASVLDDSNGTITGIRPNYNERKDIDANTLVKGNPLLTASIMFRKERIEDLPKWFFNLPFGDYGLLFLSISRGKIACLPDVMSVYRMHSGGIHSNLHASSKGMRKVIEDHLLFFKIISGELLTTPRHRMAVRKRIIFLYQKMQRVQARENNSIGVLKTKAHIFLLRFLHKIKSRLET